jgi:hypothetical protein
MAGFFGVSIDQVHQLVLYSVGFEKANLLILRGVEVKCGS